jgi:NAD(P)-dependent dehydrogenase (short-subunit alcohol dehydrogenase family)
MRRAGGGSIVNICSTAAFTAAPGASAFSASDRLVANPAEVTRLVLFLASSEASFSTGSEFVVDGGLLLGPAPARGPAVAAAA